MARDDELRGKAIDNIKKRFDAIRGSLEQHKARLGDGLNQLNAKVKAAEVDIDARLASLPNEQEIELKKIQFAPEFAGNDALREKAIDDAKKRFDAIRASFEERKTRLGDGLNQHSAKVKGAAENIDARLATLLTYFDTETTKVKSAPQFAAMVTQDPWITQVTQDDPWLTWNTWSTWDTWDTWNTWETWHTWDVWNVWNAMG